MPDRPSKESAGEQYRRLAQACLEMVPSIQDGGGREALIEMARVWLRLAESYGQEKPVMQEQQQVRPEKDDAKD